MNARYGPGLAFLLACAAPSGCIVGIADPRDAGTDGGETSGDGAQTSDGPDASESSPPSDAPQDAGGDETAAQGDTGGLDAPAEGATDVAAQDAPPLTHYLVFVTSTRYTGNLGGLTGADQKCMQSAAAATPSPLPGMFKAWMSDSTTTAAMHLTTHGTLPYVMLDMTRVADDWTALTSANGAQVQNMITIDENGSTVPGTIDVCSGFGGHYVWTNSNDDGTLFTGGGSGTCQNLTSAASTDTGNTGSASTNQMNTQWWSSWCNAQSCDSLASLYCVQQ
jgi:hypothetical protein